MIVNKTVVWMAFFTMVVGCTDIDVNLPEPSTEPGMSQGQSNDPLILSGQMRYNDVSTAGVRVLVVPEFGETYKQFEAVTDETGDFQVQVDRPGTYTLLADMPTEGGAVTTHMDKIEMDTSADLGSFDLAFISMDREYTGGQPLTSGDSSGAGEYGTTEQALGSGAGCVRAGCSSVACPWLSRLKCVCCGYNVCIYGFEVCIPYGR